MLAFMKFGKHDRSDSEDGEGDRAINNQSHGRTQPHKKALNQAREIAIARVKRQVDQTIVGRVIWEAVSYPAYCLSADTFAEGTFVQVLDRRDNTLIVGALPGTALCPKSAANRTQITAQKTAST